ncbi:hypothetical protein EMMF5_004049 [Cystobasidiomycetes sp. EMM_F5]
MPESYNKKKYDRAGRGSQRGRDGSITPTRSDVSPSPNASADEASPPRFDVRVVPFLEFYNVLPALGRLLTACVKDGASVNFVEPFSFDDALGWWRSQASSFRSGEQLLVGASKLGPQEDEDELVGCVVLKLAHQRNQQHRAEVCKMLVHPDVRRQGLAIELLQQLEVVAVGNSRWLLTLDTETDGPAESLYVRAGYTKIGAIPDYALLNDGKHYTAATFMYKLIERARPAA